MLENTNAKFKEFQFEAASVIYCNTLFDPNLYHEYFLFVGTISCDWTIITIATIVIKTKDQSLLEDFKFKEDSYFKNLELFYVTKTIVLFGWISGLNWIWCLLLL